MSERGLHDFLSMGTVGHSHLMQAAQKAFVLAEQAKGNDAINEMVTAGCRLFCLAWVEFPLNAAVAAHIVRLAGSLPIMKTMLSKKGLCLAARLAQSAIGEAPVESEEFFRQGDFVAMSRFFHAEAGKRALLPMVRQAYHYQSLLSNWDWLEEYLGRILVPVDPEVAELLLAEVYLAGGQADRAVPAFERLVKLYGMQGWGLRLAVARAEYGDTAGSLQLLEKILTNFPMHTSALLYMDSLAFPAQRSAHLDGKCVVSIYSYNKAAALAKTLDSVLASNLDREVGDISLRILINGSEDESLDVVEKARNRFDGTLDVVVLPTNIGAPAARNWLLDAAKKDGAKWIVYLDDDVLVPTDWLSGLAAGVESFPEAGVWGCRVVDARSSCLTQHGDGFLLSQEDVAQKPQRIVLHEPCVESLIPALLNYRRYAVSVTGCCHLFQVESLARSKGFDLLFSPSQFDDLDLDLRRLNDGKPAAYLGDVHITHLRESSYFLKLSESATMQSDMHRIILENRHAPHLERLLQVQSSFVQADLCFKRDRLQDAGYLPVSS